MTVAVWRTYAAMDGAGISRRVFPRAQGVDGISAGRVEVSAGIPQILTGSRRTTPFVFAGAICRVTVGRVIKDPGQYARIKGYFLKESRFCADLPGIPQIYGNKKDRQAMSAPPIFFELRYVLYDVSLLYHRHEAPSNYGFSLSMRRSIAALI